MASPIRAHRRALFAPRAVLGLLALGCYTPAVDPPSLGDETGGQAAPSAGGNSGSGGVNDSGGGSTGNVGTLGGSSSGGVFGNGGHSTAATGGKPATGGSPTAATGSMNATGGDDPTAATGGMNATGGSTAQSTSSCPTAAETTFSFFLVSQAALIRESGSQDGFGGNLGGLTGADQICQSVAEYVSPCQSSKVWHAFLSTSTVNAIDRIGTGPWHDRNGRLFANNLSELLNDRPTNADPVIKNDFPNEDGVNNSDPNNTGTAQAVDNHETLTGTGTDGKVYSQSASAGTVGTGATNCNDGTWTVAAATCWDWTSSEPKGCPRVGHSWPGMSGANWMSVWNESGCAPGGTGAQTGGTDNSRKVGSAGGYGGFYCLAVMPTP